MKRVDLVRRVEEEGAAFVRHGSSHDMYRNVITGVIEMIPRHREIDEMLARKIIRRLSSPQSSSNG
jgi:hypothetical protein